MVPGLIPSWRFWKPCSMAKKKKSIVSDTSVLPLQHFLDSHSIKVSAVKLSLKNTKNRPPKSTLLLLIKIQEISEGHLSTENKMN